MMKDNKKDTKSVLKMLLFPLLVLGVFAIIYSIYPSESKMQEAKLETRSEYIRSALSISRGNVDLYLNNTGSYSGICDFESGDINGWFVSAPFSSSLKEESGFTCRSNEEAFVVFIPNGGKAFCVDASGPAQEVSMEAIGEFSCT